MMRSLSFLVPALFMLAGASAPAAAADLDAPPAPAAPQAAGEQQLEFGTSWYLRGDIGAVMETNPKISNDLNLISDGKRKRSFSYDVGFGYKLNDWFRADLIGEYRTTQTRSGVGGLIANCPTLVLGVVTPGSCDVTGYSKFSHWNALANVYVDLGNWGGLSPYVGAGAGVSYMTARGSTAYTVNPSGIPYVSPINPLTLAPISSVANRTKATDGTLQLAWNVMAGIGYALNEHTVIDLGYRYLNMGRFTGVADSTGAIIKKQLTSHEVRLGVRYMID